MLLIAVTQDTGEDRNFNLNCGTVGTTEQRRHTQISAGGGLTKYVYWSGEYGVFGAFGTVVQQISGAGTHSIAGVVLNSRGAK